MSQVNPDPIAKLAQFTPAAPPDAAELLYAVGRASARTHWGWKLAVAGLLASNLVIAGLVALRSSEVPPAPEPEPAPSVPPQREPEPAVPIPEPVPTDDPSSYRALLGSDLEHPPKVEPSAHHAPGYPPLTALSGRRGELD